MQPLRLTEIEDFNTTTSRNVEVTDTMDDTNVQRPFDIKAGRLPGTIVAPAQY